FGDAASLVLGFFQALLDASSHTYDIYRNLIAALIQNLKQAVQDSFKLPEFFHNLRKTLLQVICNGWYLFSHGYFSRLTQKRQDEWHNYNLNYGFYAANKLESNARISGAVLRSQLRSLVLRDLSGVREGKQLIRVIRR